MRYFLFSVALVAACAAPAVFAKGSSHPPTITEGGGGYVPFDQVQRIQRFGPERHWQTDLGEILICPWDAKASSYGMECLRGKQNAWTLMTDTKNPGFEIAGVAYVQTSPHGQSLYVYWRKVEPKQPEATKATPVAPIPANVVLNTDKITITTGKVVVQRRK
jgi:hypothetical protein